MNSKLLKNDDWMKANKLSINDNKTEYLVTNKTKLQQNSINIKIGSEKMTQVNKA